MALIKQLVDIPTTGGVDTKTDSVNDSPPAMSDINNLRFTETGAYDPRPSFSALQALSATTTDFVVEARDAAISSVNRYIYKTIDGSNTQLAPIWSPKGRAYAIGGSVSQATQYTATALSTNDLMYVWNTDNTSVGYQTISNEGDLLYSGRYTISFPRFIVATAGPSGAGFIWGTNNSNQLYAYRITSAGAEVLSVPAITTITLSVTYSSTDSCWYVVYSTGGTTTLAKFTLSGTTVSSAATAAVSASGILHTDVIRSTNYVVTAHYSTVTSILTVQYFNTSLVVQATQTRTLSVSSPSDYMGFGMCEMTADYMFCSLTTNYDASGPVLHAFDFTTSAAANVWDANPVGFISPTAPVYLNSRIYLYAVDASQPGTQTATLIQIANYDGGTKSAFEVVTHWATDITSLNSVMGNFVNSEYAYKSRMALTSSVLAIPYSYFGEFLSTATSSLSSTGTYASLITSDYVVSRQFVGGMHLSLTKTAHTKAYNTGNASLVVGSSNRVIDGAGQGPASAWPSLHAYNMSLGGSGVLPVDTNYTYVFVKRWIDSGGNQVVLESLPFRVKTTSLGGGNTKPSFYFPPSAFTVYSNVNSGASSATIQVYRTERNGSIPYLLTTLTPASASPYQDNTEDESLLLSAPLPSSSGELSATPFVGSNTSTMWKGRIAVLPIDASNKVQYTKVFNPLAVPALATGLEIAVPQASSPLTALGVMDGVLYIFAANQVYTVYGDPAGDTGEGSSLTLPEIRFNGVGCEDPASVILAPPGLFFKSAKGIYLILRNQELSFVGEGPFAERGKTVVGTWADENTSEVAFVLSNGEIWVYDWQVKAWARWTPPVGTGDTITGASLVNDLPTYITQDGIYQTVSADTETFATSVTTAWIRLGSLQGYQRVYNMWLYLERLADHTLTVDMYLDGKDTSVYTWTIASTGLASTAPEQIRLSVPVQKCSAIKLKISSTNAGWKLKGIMAEIGVKDSAFKSRNAPNNY